MKQSFFVALVLIAAAFLSSACNEFLPVSERDSIQRIYKVEPGGKLSVDSDMGSIEVRAGALNEVRMDVNREARGATREEAAQNLKNLRIDFRQEGNNVYVYARRPGDDFFPGSWNNRLRLRFIVTVPDRYNLDLRTGGGSISVNDLEGTIQARTSGGSLKFGQIQGQVNGRTSGGSITVDGGTGPMDVETSGGSIRLGKVNGRVRAHTSGGSISVDEVQGQIQASTSGGGVRASITRQPEGDCELSTSGGSIHARLRRDLNLDLTAKTSGGSVRSNLPITIQGEVSRNRLEGRMNQGGPRLLLHTSGGGISIDEIP